MGEPTSLDLVSVSVRGEQVAVEIEVGDARRAFVGRIIDADGITVFACDELSRWFLDDGFLWAQRRVSETIHAVIRGAEVAFPARIDVDFAGWVVADREKRGDPSLSWVEVGYLSKYEAHRKGEGDWRPLGEVAQRELEEMWQRYEAAVQGGH